MWIGTYNASAEGILPEVAEAYLRKWHELGGAQFATGQIEKGEKCGTIHIQFFLHMKQKCTITTLKKVCPRAHFKAVYNNNGADEYTEKDHTRVAGPWTFGVRPAR